MFLVLGLIAFLIGREILLAKAVSSIKDAVVVLRAAKYKNLYFDICQRKGSQIFDGVDLVTYQLRFSSSADYVLEAVCAQLEFDPILIEKKSLPSYVEKVPGSSGLVYSSQSEDGFELVAFGDLQATIMESVGFKLPISKTQAIALEAGKLVYPESMEFVTEGPVTNCEGYGFDCCDPLTEQGVGEEITGLKSCPNACFSSCINRPSLLSFTTSPFYNPQTRRLQISRGSGVEFHYVVDGSDADQVKAKIDFGDGETRDLAAGETSTTHRYQCAYGTCEYEATIILMDKWGVKSYPSSISKIVIEVL